jgi:hypothetical protein
VADHPKLWTSGEFVTGASILLVGVLMVLQRVLFEGDKLSDAGESFFGLW